jgi:hypothetical protein
VIVTDWLQPDLSSQRFEVRYGASVVTEFVLAHTPADVLRELVQNEYDAEGRSLEIVFGRDGLEVRGDGKGIDQAGWTRLSVMLGTGMVGAPSAQETVQPKVNGIGSKNFGLRSLWLFGDSIFIRSAGKQTVLDWRLGVMPQPIVDASSAQSPGVTLYVPYRQTDSEHFRAFDADREREAIQEICDELATALVKLATPGGAKTIRSVRLISRRLDRELEWRQTVKEVSGRVRALRRQVRIRQTGQPEGCINSSPPHSTSRVPTKVPMGELDGQRAEPS